MPDHTDWHNHQPDKPSSDDEFFERMSKVIFLAGLNWHTLDKKWPGIKQAFANFTIDIVATFQEPEIEERMMNPDVIRNLPKIRAIVANAKEMQSITREYGSFAAYLESLRKSGCEDGMRAGISKRFAFLGPSTAIMFLFSVGEDMSKAHAELQAKQQHRPSSRDL